MVQHSKVHCVANLHSLVARRGDQPGCWSSGFYSFGAAMDFYIERDEKFGSQQIVDVS